jgi:hypothetical protein
MNFKQSYEQLIADKLRKLPAPDADASWQQMKRLLDDDEDRGGGAKRPPGNKGGWWRMGIIAVILSTGLWLYVEKTSAPNAPLAKNNTTAPSTANNKPAEKGNSSVKNNTSENKKTAIIDNNTTLTDTKATITAKNTAKITAAIAAAPTAGNTKNNTAVNKPVIPTAAGKNINTVVASNTGENIFVKANNPANKNLPARINTVKNVTAGANSIGTKTNSTLLIQPATENKHGNIKNSTANPYDAGNSVAGTRVFRKNIKSSTANTSFVNADEKNETAAGISNAGSTLPPSAQRTGKIKHTNGGKALDNNMQQDDKTVSSLYAPVNQPAGSEEKNWFEQLTDLKTIGAIPSSNTSLAIKDSIESNRNTGSLLNNETKKQVAKVQRDQALEDMTKKEKKSLHLDLSNVFKPFSLHMDAEPRWAAGISLNSGITLNAQNRYNYNMNAKSGTLSDYIPSVYLQFHLNDYVYAQTEINFISPQYTPQLLVFQQSNDVTAQAGISQQKSIYIQKLYYFNLPLSLHYSPINNLYFSAGLQFSSFQSGLVSIQEKQYTTLSGPDHPNSVSNSILKFKDDSIAAKLAPNEWRWQAGADYYWNRFTIGMRYNRSFKDLLNVNLSASLPPTTLRNESLIFFMRYNLFESRKKTSLNQKD